jgi:5-hydroxyisourate hydrolase
MAGITTHVLDTAAGRPAAGIPLTLEFRDDNATITLVEATTDDDGRALLSDGSTLTEGTYRIRFDTGAYHGDTAFFPEVTIEFRVVDVDDHHHLPLLLSPFGYSTYRGS